MQIDFDKILEIYGESMIELIRDNKDDVIENLKYLYYLEFNDVEDIFERYPGIFICSNKEFVKKMKILINELGYNYVEILETNMDLWGNLE